MHHSAAAVQKSIAAAIQNTPGRRPCASGGGGASIASRRLLHHARTGTASQASSAAADQNSARGRAHPSSRAEIAPAMVLPAAKRRDVETAGRVAEVELVAEMRDDEPRRRLEVGEPGEHHVSEPGEPIATELHPRRLTTNGRRLTGAAPPAFRLAG